jgi:hypothetical protein
MPGGGGGAGAVGQPIGVGGVGILNPISGSTTGELLSGSYWLAGGGGSSDDSSSYNGTSGKGNGSTNASRDPIANTGGGAWGAGVGNPGTGATGVVIIRYKFQN